MGEYRIVGNARGRHSPQGIGWLGGSWTLAERPQTAEVGMMWVTLDPPTAYVSFGPGTWYKLGTGDTATTVLEKLLTVDANDSGLNAATLQGATPASFLAAAGKAVDSDLLDGRDSTTFASLVSGVVPESQIPAVAITDTFEVATEAAMLALVAQRGDVAVRSDLNKSFVLRATSASTLSNWAELRTPTDAVLSVDGRTGAFSLSDLYAAANDARLRTIRDEGIAVTNRAILDFIGSGVIVEDDAVTGRTKVTVSGAAAGAASETAPGITEQATQAEVEAGTAGNLFATVARLKAYIDSRFTPEAWIAPTLTNGWINSGGGLATAGFRKEPYGLVRLKGSVKNGATGIASPLFTLPAGYRPSAETLFLVENNGAVAFLGVQSTGAVYVFASSNNARVTLDAVVLPV